MVKDNRIPIKYNDSYRDFVVVIGRYPCMEIGYHKENNKHYIRLCVDGGWVECLVNKNDINRIKKMACRDKGSLYVNIDETGHGVIYDEEL